MRLMPISRSPETRPRNGPAPATLSAARQALIDAVRASVVLDRRGEKILEAVRLAEDREASARRELDSILEMDRANAEKYFDAADGPKPDASHAARAEAERALKEAQATLAMDRAIQSEHQRAMAPAHERAQRAANQIPTLVLDVLQEECEARIEELQHRMVVCNALSIQIEGLALLAKQLGDGGRHEGYRLFEVLRGRIKEAMRTLTPAEAFSPPMRQSIQAWMRADAALRADPEVDIESIITPKKGP